MDQELIRQQKQTQINKDNIRENIKRVDHDYKLRDEFMLNNNAAYKYENPYKVPFVINQCWTNCTVTLKCGTTKIGIIYITLSHIHLIQTLKILPLEICVTMSTYDHQVYTSVLYIKYCT